MLLYEDNAFPRNRLRKKEPPKNNVWKAHIKNSFFLRNYLITLEVTACPLAIRSTRILMPRCGSDNLRPLRS